MANLKEIRNRIGSVRNTRKITSAMSRIAAARLVKAQYAVRDARPYGERLEEIVENLLISVDTSEGAKLHPFLQANETPRRALVAINADRGLCGGFNANVNRAALEWIRRHQSQGEEVVLIGCGKKIQSFLRHEGYDFFYVHDAPDHASLIDRAKAIATEVSALFTGEIAEKRVASVDLIYNFFRSVLTQEVRQERLLPIAAPEEGSAIAAPLLFEPDAQTLLSHLLPVVLESRLQQAMLNSIASEIASRRTAMNAATDNATQLIGELTLEYNRERQAAITKELMEIIGGAEALKG